MTTCSSTCIAACTGSLTTIRRWNDAVPPSRVVRYAVSLARLRAYTASTKAALPTCLQKKRTPSIDPHECWLECARFTRDRGQNWNDAIVDACVAACERRSPSTCGRVRLVGVGAKKTGTTSLSAVCRLLGLREMGLRAKARCWMRSFTYALCGATLNHS